MPFTLTVDAAALGIAGPERLTVAELVSGNAVQHEVQGDLLLIWGELAPLDTVVFRLEEGLVPTTVYLPLIQKASERIMDPISGGRRENGAATQCHHPAREAFLVPAPSDATPRT